MEFLILSFLIAGLFVRNTAQDIVYKKIRGEDPPYLIRRRERAARRGVPTAEQGPARRFFADAWEDAWEDAREKRARAHAKKQQERREGWAERDAVDALEDEAWKANREWDHAHADQQADPADEPAPSTDPSPSEGDDGATVTEMDRWRKTPSGDNTPEEETVSVNAETTTLDASLAYTQGMADSHSQAVSSNELSIASMQGGGVSGRPIELLTQAQELEGQLAALYEEAHAALLDQVPVQEAYHANPDAGDKEFVSQD